MLTSSGGVAFLHTALTILILQMNVSGFMAHQESGNHGKLGEVMKMLALDILVLRDVSVAVLCQTEDGGLLKAWQVCKAETAMNDIIITVTVRSPWAHRGTMMSFCFFVGEAEQIQRLSSNALMDNQAEFKKKQELWKVFLGCDDSVFVVNVVDVFSWVKHSVDSRVGEGLINHFSLHDLCWLI